MSAVLPVLWGVLVSAYLLVCVVINPLVIPAFDRFPCTEDPAFDVIQWTTATGFAAVLLLGVLVLIEAVPSASKACGATGLEGNRTYKLVQAALTLACGAAFLFLAAFGLAGVSRTTCRYDTFAVALDLNSEIEFVSIRVGAVPDPQLGKFPRPVLGDGETQLPPATRPDGGGFSPPAILPVPRDRAGDKFKGGLLDNVDDTLYLNIPIPVPIQAFLLAILGTPFLWILHVVGMLLTAGLGAGLAGAGTLALIGEISSPTPRKPKGEKGNPGAYELLPRGEAGLKRY